MLAAESGVEYGEESFERGLDVVTAAYREGIGAGDDQRLRLVRMWRGEHLSVLDRYDEAFAIAADGLAAARRDRQGWAYQMFETWRARMLFATGRLSEATVTLEGASVWRMAAARRARSRPPASSLSACWHYNSATRDGRGGWATSRT